MNKLIKKNLKGNELKTEYLDVMTDYRLKSIKFFRNYIKA